MSIKHSFVTGRPDNGDPGAIQPSHWDADHVVSGMVGALLALAAAPNVVPYIDGNGNGAAAPLSGAGKTLMNVADLPTLLGMLGAAPLNSPAFLNSPSAPTPPNIDNSTRLATTEFVRTLVAALISSAPATLDTLNELATALGNDPNFATTVSTALGNRLRIDANQGLTPQQHAYAMANLAITYGDITTGKPTLGTASALNVGTAANNVVQLDVNAHLPAVDGSALTNLAWSNVSGKPAFATVATSGNYADLAGKPTLAAVAISGNYADLAGRPTLGSAAGYNVGGPNGVVVLDANSKLPALDGSQLSNVPGVGGVRYDATQTLTVPQQIQALQNLGRGPKAYSIANGSGSYITPARGYYLAIVSETGTLGRQALYMLDFASASLIFSTGGWAAATTAPAAGTCSVGCDATGVHAIYNNLGYAGGFTVTLFRQS